LTHGDTSCEPQPTSRTSSTHGEQSCELQPTSGSPYPYVEQSCGLRPAARASSPRGESSFELPPAAGSSSPRDDLPFEAWLVALATLTGMGPARLGALCRRWSPMAAWSAVAERTVLAEPDVVATMGKAPAEVAARWAVEAAGRDVGGIWAAHVRAGVGVTTVGGAGYPGALRHDVDAPPLLFHLGDLDRIGGPRVAIVGTRRCTRLGLDVARDLGHDLTASGVQIVSGLALGIDGAAHQGALDAASTGGVPPPVGVVASGLDVVYPRRHVRLFHRVATTGVVLSEAPLGTRPDRWRFPARNRIVAGLADIVVVVESPESGGSMYTVRSALQRSRQVMAVPGAVRSPAAAGTNKLLSEGVAPVRDADDVLIALGLQGIDLRRRPRTDRRPRPTGSAAEVLDAIAWQPVTVEQLAQRTGLPLVELSEALTRLAGDGWVDQRSGWVERVARAEADRP
jgi:DNA processing protein